MGPEEDLNEDGIVIADMNVEGMPWYRSRKRDTVKADCHYSLREWIWIYQGALKAALVVGICASLFLILFTLFCVKVWLK